MVRYLAKRALSWSFALIFASYAGAQDLNFQRLMAMNHRDVVRAYLAQQTEQNQLKIDLYRCLEYKAKLEKDKLSVNINMFLVGLGLGVTLSIATAALTKLAAH